MANLTFTLSENAKKFSFANIHCNSKSTGNYFLKYLENSKVKKLF